MLERGTLRVSAGNEVIALAVLCRREWIRRWAPKLQLEQGSIGSSPPACARDFRTRDGST